MKLFLEEIKYDDHCWQIFDNLRKFLQFYSLQLGYSKCGTMANILT